MRKTVAAKAVENQIANLSKLSLAAHTDGATLGQAFPKANRIATYQTAVPIGILSVVLTYSIVNPINTSPAGVIVAVGNETTIGFAQSGIILCQQFCAGATAAIPVSGVSGVAYDGKSVEYLSSGSSVSIYAFGPADASVLIAAGACFKFAVVG